LLDQFAAFEPFMFSKSELLADDVYFFRQIPQKHRYKNLKFSVFPAICGYFFQKNSSGNSEAKKIIFFQTYAKRNYFSFDSSEIESFLLPFFLRLANTLRPLAVCMRLRKP
jgi:hypothetical protein